MKKIAMFLAAVAVAVSASAQKTAVTSSKFGDNWYVGINAGASAPGKNFSVMKNLNPEVGVRVGKNLTTVFGLALDVNARFGKKPFEGYTFVKDMNASLLGTFNFMNLFGGYNGEPRSFEIIGLAGFGWGHVFGKLPFGVYDEDGDIYVENHTANSITSKLALDFAYNFGSDKQCQIYIEPAITYDNVVFASKSAVSYTAMGYRLDRSRLGLKIGFNYKFMNSNGRHNFAIEQLRDQAEIDGLNAKINGLRGDLDAANAANAQKDAQIAQLKKALEDCQNKPAPVVETKIANLQPSVVFAQGKSVIEKSQVANVEMIAKYMRNNPNAKVKISGYASPEGPKDLNQRLSEARAAAVKTMLVKKYGISADRLTSEGLGATDKLFEEIEFNRVALFNDTTK